MYLAMLALLATPKPTARGGGVTAYPQTGKQFGKAPNKGGAALELALACVQATTLITQSGAKTRRAA